MYVYVLCVQDSIICQQEACNSLYSKCFVSAHLEYSKLSEALLTLYLHLFWHKPNNDAVFYCVAHLKNTDSNLN